MVTFPVYVTHGNGEKLNTCDVINSINSIASLSHFPGPGPGPGETDDASTHTLLLTGAQGPSAQRSWRSSDPSGLPIE